MLAIWKYELPAMPVDQIIPMPQGSKVLSVHNQNERIAIWVEVNPNLPEVLRTFQVRGTGMTYHGDARFKFIGTVLTQTGALVWHVFEKEEQS